MLPSHAIRAVVLQGDLVKRGRSGYQSFLTKARMESRVLHDRDLAVLALPGLETAAASGLILRRAARYLVSLGGLCFAGGGCVAEIHEERLFGAPRTLVESKSETIEERRVDDASPGGVACREVTITYPMVRDVTLRRSFVDDAQTRNVALATLLGAGVAFLAYGANQSACSANTGACPDFAVVTTAEAVLAALSAIPIAFIGYNAIRVQDGRATEYVTPGWRPGLRAPCKDHEVSKDDATATE